MGQSLVYMEQPNKTIEEDSGEDDRVKFAAGGMQGWRINMEDAHIANLKFESDANLFGVFDGHGGQEVALYTRKYLESIIKATEAYKQKDYREALRQSFLDIDNKLENQGGIDEIGEMRQKNPPNKSPIMKMLQGNEENPMLDSIGCTSNVVYINYSLKKVFVANAGDSRSVMGRGGNCVALSFDHKPENEEEKKRIYDAGSVVTEGRVDGNLNLSRALGDLKHKQKKEFKPEQQPITANPDTYEYEFTEDTDFIFIGCDGVWEVKSNEQMVQWIYERLNKHKKISDANLQAIVEELLNETISPNTQETGGIGCDNMTACLIVFKKHGDQ